MKRTHAPLTHSRWICAGLLALLLALPAAAAPEGQVAEIENTGSKMIFYPTLEQFDRILLTVTGPCNYVYREVIEPGGVGVFQTSPETIDAIYRLELVAFPKVSGNILEVLADARKTNDNSRVDALCREGALPGDPPTQTLGFRIFRGEILWDPNKIEDPTGFRNSSAADGGSGLGVPLKDFVINDDLIVDGSACIGFDCVNGESFGFDTIRLKEHNLRIKFDDTSTASSFPRNDWQLTANASANGGASKFSIDDISGSRTPFTVEANARSHSLYVDDGGRIGNRTSTPSVEIHTIDGDTPTLRLQQDGSSGFAPQTWDVAGNETNFFIRDVTNGSTLPFRIRPGAPTSSIFVDVDGDVGMGTASPDGRLEIADGSNSQLILVEDHGDATTTEPGLGINTNSPEAMLHMVTGTDNEGRLRFEDSATQLWEMGGGAGDTFIVNDPDGGDGAEMTIFTTGDVTIQGALTTSGATCNVTPCDGVFKTDYELPTIEDHAASMWENSYLPNIGPTAADQPMNLSQKMAGVLNELETAHIYIEQLNDSVKGKDGVIADLNQRLARLEALLLQQAD